MIVQNVRRVVLLNYDKGQYLGYLGSLVQLFSMLLTNLLATSQVEFRHFAIQTRLAAKKKIQNLLSGNKAVPDLGKYESIEQYMQGKWFSTDIVTLVIPQISVESTCYTSKPTGSRRLVSTLILFLH